MAEDAIDVGLAERVRREPILRHMCIIDESMFARTPPPKMHRGRELSDVFELFTYVTPCFPDLDPLPFDRFVIWPKVLVDVEIEATKMAFSRIFHARVEDGDGAIRMRVFRILG